MDLYYYSWPTELPIPALRPPTEVGSSVRMRRIRLSYVDHSGAVSSDRG